MIIAIDEFTLRAPIAPEAASEIFQSTAPKYKGMPGLLRKHYFVSEDRKTVGGIYLWTSREAAERVFTDEWRAFVRAKYDTEPKITYFECPVTVDNVGAA